MIEISKYKVIGNILTVCSIIFIIYKINLLSVNIETYLLDYKFYLLIIVLTIVMSSTIFILSNNWYLIIKFLINNNLNYFYIKKCYIKSNLCKYLPGNVMQFVGRASLKEYVDISNKYIAVSTIIEIISLAFTSLLITIIFAKDLVYNQLMIRINNISNKSFVFFAIAIMVFMFIFFIYYIKKNSKLIKSYLNKKFIKTISVVILRNGFVFLIHGLTLIVIIYYISGTITFINIPIILCAYIVGWLIGFCIPGSPGGLGVKESIIILILSGMANESVIAISVFTHRIITILADILAYIVVSFCKSKRI